MYFKAHLTHTASLCNIMGKSKEISQDIRKRIVGLHKSGSSLAAKMPELDYSLLMHTKTKTFIFGDMFCGLKKLLKLNCLARMTIVTFGGKSGKLASLRT